MNASTIKMIASMLPMEGIKEQLHGNSDKLFKLLLESLGKDIELQENEAKKCVFLFEDNQIQYAMLVTVNENYQIQRKISVSNLKEMLKNLDIDKLLNSL